MHIKKLCVGIETVDQLRILMTQRATLGTENVCAYTTNKPVKADELIASGSLYWVIKGKIRARQKITGFGTWVDDNEKVRATIILDSTVIETEYFPHRPFQGWRYLKNTDTPKDIAESDLKDLDPNDAQTLRDLGIL